jgi:hypothetical protein
LERAGESRGKLEKLERAAESGREPERVGESRGKLERAGESWRVIKYIVSVVAAIVLL